MAKKIITQLISDLSDAEADETIEFAYAGQRYEIDLTTAEAKQFGETLAPYVGVATRKGSANGRGAKKSTSATRSNGADPKDVRRWAQDNGIDVPDRGRIPATVREQYSAAH